MPLNTYTPLAIPTQDFVFCKEVRLGTYSPNASVLPPAAIVAAKAMAVDPRAEPRFAERIPYVVSSSSNALQDERVRTSCSPCLPGYAAL